MAMFWFEIEKLCYGSESSKSSSAGLFNASFETRTVIHGLGGMSEAGFAADQPVACRARGVSRFWMSTSMAPNAAS
jgi:hypothetical protein